MAMEFDFVKTLALIKGGLLDHETTWNEYLGENPEWKKTALLLTGPLLIANVLLGVIFSRLIGGYSYYGYSSNIFSAIIMALLAAAIGFFIAVFVFNFLAGTFKGTPHFPRAFAAVSLAAIPAWVAGPVAGLIPVIGVFIALAGGILSLVFMYRIMPLALEVPDDKRTVHFVVSLVVIIIINMVIGLAMGGKNVSREFQSKPYTSDSSTSQTTSASGIVGEMARQGELMNAANADVYDPPGDGKLEQEQVEKYLSVLRKTRDIHQAYSDKMDKIAAEIKAKEEAGEGASLADLGKMYSGMGGAVSANNAEMEVVKTGGGNWAEHTWVKQQLRSAAIQQGEGSDAIAHNYEIYQQYREVLEEE
jgi:hypothetical protein